MEFNFGDRHQTRDHPVLGRDKNMQHNVLNRIYYFWVQYGKNGRFLVQKNDQIFPSKL